MTGCRPEAWALCQLWMQQQEIREKVRWIIVDDGAEQQEITFKRRNWKLEVVRPQPYWKPEQNTQARNILAGLELVGADDRLIIIEDDDYYAPDYLAVVSSWLDYHDLVGEALARYYHVGERLYHECGNQQHASLCSTAMKGAAIDQLRVVARLGEKFIDMALWKSFPGTKQLYGSRLCVGIKGLPGRMGIGMGHRMNGIRHRKDPGGMVLKSWVGRDWEHYKPWYKSAASRS